MNYLINDGLCPFTSKELLEDIVLLQSFVTPIYYSLDKNIIKHYKQKNSYDNSTNYGFNPDTIGKILTDFIDFVCEFKGYKIGVGQALISKFIKEKVEY